MERLNSKTNNYFKLVAVSMLGLRSEAFFFFNDRSLLSKSQARYNLIQATEELKKAGALKVQQGVYRKIQGTPIPELGDVWDDNAFDGSPPTPAAPAAAGVA